MLEPRSRYNSVNQIIEWLEKNPFSTEGQVQWYVFGYSRSSRRPNKKYADMLRRGIQKGKIARIKADVKGSREKFYYYIPKQN